MRLLPKSIHRCRRYPTKFNSGRDIPGILASDLFVTQGVDLHLKGAPNVALNSALDLSASFVLDIDGQTRAGLTWDRGADELGAPTAVELVSFGAIALDGGVELTWETASELNNLGFQLYRSTSERGPYERITSRLIPGLGSSPAGARYRYLDSGLTNGTIYHYQLEDVETSGETKRHGPVSAMPAAGIEDAPSAPGITWGEPASRPAGARRCRDRAPDRGLLCGAAAGWHRSFADSRTRWDAAARRKALDRHGRRS